MLQRRLLLYADLYLPFVSSVHGHCMHLELMLVFDQGLWKGMRRGCPHKNWTRDGSRGIPHKVGALVPHHQDRVVMNDRCVILPWPRRVCVPVAARWHIYILLNLWDPCLPRTPGCSSSTGVRLPSYWSLLLPKFRVTSFKTSKATFLRGTTPWMVHIGDATWYMYEIWMHLPMFLILDK